MKWIIGIYGFKFLVWLTEISKGRIYSWRLAMYLYRLTWKDDDWKYETK